MPTIGISLLDHLLGVGRCLLILLATRHRNAKVNNRSEKIYAKLVAATENYKHNNRKVMKIKNEQGNTEKQRSRKCYTNWAN
jgi:hypothetical protein